MTAAVVVDGLDDGLDRDLRRGCRRMATRAGKTGDHYGSKETCDSQEGASKSVGHWKNDNQMDKQKYCTGDQVILGDNRRHFGW